MLNYFLQGPLLGSRWKWAIIAAHQGLYGLLICALKGAAPILTVCETDYKKGDRKKKDAWRLYTQGQSTDAIAAALRIEEQKVKEWFAHPKLISLNEALKRMKNKACLPGSTSKRLETSPEEDEALTGLIDEFRNNVEHFVPKSWIIDTKNFLTMFPPVVRVMRFVALESNIIYFEPDEDYASRITQAFQNIEDRLQQGANKKEATVRKATR